MLPRGLILTAFLLYLFGIGQIIHEPRFSVIEKSAFLFASACWIVFRKYDPFVLIILIITIVFSAILGVFTNYPQFSWTSYFNALNQFSVLYIFLSIYPSKFDKKFYFVMIAVIPVACVILGSILQIAGLHNLYGREFATGLYRLGGSLIPSYLSAFCMCAMVASLLLLIENRKLLYAFLLAANLVIALLAGGRTTLSVSILMMALMILTTRHVRSDHKIISLVGGFFIFALLIITVGQSVIQRFVESGDNGRDLLWSFTLSLAEKYPLGVGFGGQFWATPDKIIAYTGSGATHNDFVRLSAELGYGGMVAFYLLLTAAVARTWWRGERNAMPWIGYIGFLLLSLSDNVLASPSQYILLVLGSFANSPDAFAITQSREGRRFWRMAAYAERQPTVSSSR